MEINTNLLQIYFDKKDMPISINLDTHSTEPCITFRRGKDDDGQNVGGIRVHLTLTNIGDLLELNKPIKLENEWKYEVLGSYVIQMLFGYGNLLSKNIKPLSGHETYFREY